MAQRQRIRRRSTDPRIVGGRYHSGYWHSSYTVLAIESHNGVRWFTERDDDGQVRKHCTAWDADRDRELGQPCRMIACGWNHDGA